MVTRADVVECIELDLGLQRGFVDTLSTEDGWSFVIKLHAFFESLLAQHLHESLGRPELEEVITRLEFSNRRVGKLAFARSLGLLSKKERRFLSALSELRNQLVHDVRRTQFTWSEYISSLDKNQRREFMKAFGYAYRDYWGGKDDLDWPEKQPQNIILLAAMDCVWRTFSQKRGGLAGKLRQRLGLLLSEEKVSVGNS